MRHCFYLLVICLCTTACSKEATPGITMTFEKRATVFASPMHTRVDTFIGEKKNAVFYGANVNTTESDSIFFYCERVWRDSVHVSSNLKIEGQSELFEFSPEATVSLNVRQPVTIGIYRQEIEIRQDTLFYSWDYTHAPKSPTGGPIPVSGGKLWAKRRTNNP